MPPEPAQRRGHALERDTQAYDAFVSLKKSDQMRIALLRGGERLELVFKIEPQPGRVPSQSDSPPPDSVKPASPPPAKPAAAPPK